MESVICQIIEGTRTTPVKVYLWETPPLPFPHCKIFSGQEGCKLIFGQWEHIKPILEQNQLQDYLVECDRRNSAIPLLDIENCSARIEPGAILRQQVSIGENAVIMMGAILNIGAKVGKGTMIDMGAVLGGKATVGENCHIGAGAVLAGVIEPASAVPVVIEDDVMIGANAVILEGVRIGAGAVVAAGAVVTADVAPNTVVAGCPARFVKWKDEKTAGKTSLTDGLR